MKDTINQQIGAWLREKRKEKGRSMQEVADALEVTRTAVHYWESGKRTIYADTLVHYCQFIGASLQELQDHLFRGS